MCNGFFFVSNFDVHRSQTSNGIAQQEQGTLQQARSADAGPAYAARGEL